MHRTAQTPTTANTAQTKQKRRMGLRRFQYWASLSRDSQVRPEYAFALGGSRAGLLTPV